MPPQQTEPGVLRRVSKGLAAAVFGLAFAALVFMALPFLQMVANLKKKEVKVTEVVMAEDEPPPPELEQPEPDIPEPEELPPTPEPQVSFDDLAKGFDLSSSGASNAPFVQDALRDAFNKRSQNAMAMGGAVKEPRAIKRVPPRVPSALKRAGISGMVKVECVVDANGRVLNPRIVGSAPDPRLEQPTIAAVLKWRFEPGTRDGIKCPFKVRIPIRFS